MLIKRLSLAIWNIEVNSDLIVEKWLCFRITELEAHLKSTEKEKTSAIKRYLAIRAVTSKRHTSIPEFDRHNYFGKRYTDIT